MTTMTLTAKQEEQVESYKQDILSGRTFALHAASARSRRGYMPPINRRGWATCIGVLAQMAERSDALAQVANEIVGRINLYGDDSQAQATVYERAGEALAKGYNDVIGRAGPEAGRYSDHQRAFTLAERVEIMYWLELATRPFSCTVHGVGWCLAAVAAEVKFTPTHEMAA